MGYMPKQPAEGDASSQRRTFAGGCSEGRALAALRISVAEIEQKQLRSEGDEMPKTVVVVQGFMRSSWDKASPSVRIEVM